MSLRRPGTAELFCSTDVNAFACVMAIAMFAVLACCMTTMGDHYPGDSLDLPRVLHPVLVGDLSWGANRDEAMIIAVARDGTTFMTNKKVATSALASEISRRLGAGAEHKVYIRADARARYGNVKSVLDAIHSTGLKNVAFLAYQRRNPVTLNPSLP
ncbi:MAG: hypothetical protein DMG93_08105 [Acidobacteria bacterium]|nr:MAG: hypothetical protein DMG93_08105 [Acidobacteriota bacterium]